MEIAQPTTSKWGMGDIQARVLFTAFAVQMLIYLRIGSPPADMSIWNLFLKELQKQHPSALIWNRVMKLDQSFAFGDFKISAQCPIEYSIPTSFTLNAPTIPSYYEGPWKCAYQIYGPSETGNPFLAVMFNALHVSYQNHYNFSLFCSSGDNIFAW